MGRLRDLLLIRRKKSKSLTKTPILENPFRSLSISRTTSNTETQIEELKHVFAKFDMNGDGKISQSELGSILTSLGHQTSDEELRKMIDEVDADGDGFIDMEEFIELNTAGVDPIKLEEDLKHAFKVFDVDGNGVISPCELQRVMKSLGDEQCSIDECKKMISAVDVDGDGMINYAEFRIMMVGGVKNSHGNSGEISRGSNA